MLESLVHNELFLLGMLVGLVVGAALGYALGHDRGRIAAFDQMQADAEAAANADKPALAPPLDPYDAIRNEIRRIESGAAGPFVPFGEF